MKLGFCFVRAALFLVLLVVWSLVKACGVQKVPPEYLIIYGFLSLIALPDCSDSSYSPLVASRGNKMPVLYYVPIASTTPPAHMISAVCLQGPLGNASMFSSLFGRQ